VAIILLSQLPRAAEHRNTPLPKSSDLKKYGAIEKYVDKVLFIFREEYYAQTKINKGIAKIIIAKNNAGNIGIVDAKFDSSCFLFEDRSQSL